MGADIIDVAVVVGHGIGAGRLGTSGAASV